jgi:hypothetical protein
MAGANSLPLATIREKNVNLSKNAVRAEKNTALPGGDEGADDYDEEMEGL